MMHGIWHAYFLDNSDAKTIIVHFQNGRYSLKKKHAYDLFKLKIKTLTRCCHWAPEVFFYFNGDVFILYYIKTQINERKE